jgi:hypothetical protein
MEEIPEISLRSNRRTEKIEMGGKGPKTFGS